MILPRFLSSTYLIPSLSCGAPTAATSSFFGEFEAGLAGFELLIEPLFLKLTFLDGLSVIDAANFAVKF